MNTFCTCIRTGEKFDIFWVSCSDVTKWLDSAPYKIAKIEPLIVVSPRSMKLDRYMQHVETYKKASWRYTVNPTGSRPY